MKQRLSNDTCRCKGVACRESEKCLRHTDTPEGRYSFTDTLRDNDTEPCKFFITIRED
jgi:hypothetical protein